MNNQITQKQQDFINDMIEFGGCPVFKGTTKQEASKYIDDYIELFKLNSTPNWCYEHGYF